MNPGSDKQQLDSQLQALFGRDARSDSPLTQTGTGASLHGINLCQTLNPQ